MEDLENLAASNFEGYTKKEGILKRKELEKLQRNLNGIRHMQRIPQFMIVADPNEDLIAVKEARKRNIKVIGVIDTNTNPDLVDLGIPANDDSLKSLNLIITLLADAIIDARGGTLQYAYKTDDQVILPVDQNSQNNQNRFNRRDANFKRRNFENNKNPKEIKAKETTDKTNVEKKAKETEAN